MTNPEFPRNLDCPFCPVQDSSQHQNSINYFIPKTGEWKNQAHYLSQKNNKKKMIKQITCQREKYRGSWAKRNKTISTREDWISKLFLQPQFIESTKINYKNKATIMPDTKRSSFQ